MRYFKHPFPYLAALAITLLYFALPSICQWVAAKPTFADYAYLDASKISHSLQKGLVYPFGKWCSKVQRAYVVFPYWLVLMVTLRAFYLHTRRWWAYGTGLLALLLLLLYLFPNLLLSFDNQEPSQSQGHVANGRIEHSKRMYFRGDNYTTYSFLCYLAGRTYVNDRVREAMLAAYEACQKERPEITFVVGEIGRKHGGRFLPHRTHQNGLSVDFMSPLLKKEEPYRNHHLFNLWGYLYEFDDKGQKGRVGIDYETMALHLYHLREAAEAEGLVIQKVIFDPVLRPYLLDTEYGPRIKNLPFTKKRVIIRHDDHYHVDFGIPSR